MLWSQTIYFCLINVHTVCCCITLIFVSGHQVMQYGIDTCNDSNATYVQHLVEHLINEILWELTLQASSLLAKHAHTLKNFCYAWTDWLEIWHECQLDFELSFNTNQVTITLLPWRLRLIKWWWPPSWINFWFLRFCLKLREIKEIDRKVCFMW